MIKNEENRSMQNTISEWIDKGTKGRVFLSDDISRGAPYLRLLIDFLNVMTVRIT